MCIRDRLVGAHVLEITKTFYPIMFNNNPEVLQFFNKTNQVRGKQPEALANAVASFAMNIEHLDRLGTAVDIIAHKHCGLGVRPEHYAIVETNLLKAVGVVLGDQLTPAVVDAWREAVHFLAGILIERERQLYEEAAARQGGFKSWKDFVVAERRMLADDIALIKFQPASGPSAFDFTPGQFLTLQLDVGEAYPAKRHYTVVSAPGDDHLAIAVKAVPPEREGVPAGVVSNALVYKVREGDVVQLMPPFGTFVCGAAAAAPPNRKEGQGCPFHHASTSNGSAQERAQALMFFSAGIGITPIQAMLKVARKRAEGQAIVAFHQDHCQSTHVFQEVAGLADHSFVKYSREHTECFQMGRVTKEDIRAMFESSKTSPQTTRAHVCGPAGFTHLVIHTLQEMGIQEVHAELFGPQLSMN